MWQTITCHIAEIVQFVFTVPETAAATKV